MRAFVEGIGLVGPGLNGWQASRAALAGKQPYQAAPTAVAASPLLPAVERRRAGMPVRLALAAGIEAIENSGLDAAALATVFTSSSGDCDNVHAICESLAAPDRQVSPTRFHNSVHNAAAGYWSIATQCRAASTSLCAYDASFGAGLLDAASQVELDRQPVALIAYDHPYPAPLGAAREIKASFGVALVLAPARTSASLAALEIGFEAQAGAASRMQDDGLEALRGGVPAARCLPLLAQIARGSPARLLLEMPADTRLRVEVTPCT
jgi:hypothetical protein